MLSALLLLAAMCVLLVPEWRTLPLRVAFGALFVTEAVIYFRRLWASGMLGLTPRQMARAPSRPRFSWLSLAAVYASIPAMVVLSLRPASA